MFSKIIRLSLFSLFVSSPALAQSYRQLYDSLKVPEKTQPNSPVLQKVVGGLTCAKSPQKGAVVPDYNCTAELKGMDSAKIYAALDVPEKDGRKVDAKGKPTLGKKIMVKAVNGFSCTKGIVVAPDAKPDYSCSFGM